MKFIKKPIVIDAMQYRTDFPQEWPEELKDAVCFSNHGEPGKPPLELLPAHIHTLEGVMTVNNKDYVIRGVKGEFYPCKPDIFEETYSSYNPKVFECSRGIESKPKHSTLKSGSTTNFN